MDWAFWIHCSELVLWGYLFSGTDFFCERFGATRLSRCVFELTGCKFETLCTERLFISVVSFVGVHGIGVLSHDFCGEVLFSKLIVSIRLSSRLDIVESCPVFDMWCVCVLSTACSKIVAFGRLSAERGNFGFCGYLRDSVVWIVFLVLGWGGVGLVL